METPNSGEHNFNSISPSAKSLLFMKGHTKIPFARQAAELATYPGKYIPDFNKRDLTFWARVIHFESRYYSIDQLLANLPIKNILEISSGFSFRGLEMTKEEGFYYIDTDLPDIINLKKDFINDLQDNSIHPESKLELLPLNAMDENEFRKTVNRFPAGEIVIVNEGLLMYLDDTEKEKLCRIIHNILKERGGYWITADIYIKKKLANLNLKFDPQTKKFFEQHHIEENKFDSFKEATAFFKRMGFAINKEAGKKFSKLSSLKYLLKSVGIMGLFKMSRAPKMQATWRLQVKEI